MFDEFDKTFGGVFPSPIGELHFSILLLNVINVTGKKFPSPIGELHFSILLSFLSSRGFLVSVPYRGATFLNDMMEFNIFDILFPSPIGELHFSISMKTYQNLTVRQFPSPIGELHFSILI